MHKRQEEQSRNVFLNNAYRILIWAWSIEENEQRDIGPRLCSSRRSLYVRASIRSRLEPRKPASNP